jgi:hypothetical protein
MSADTALLIIDVQMGLFDDADTRDRAVLERIATLLERARATRTPVIFVQHDGGPGHPLEAGTPGWRIHPAVTPLDEEPIVRKRASDSFYKTRLQHALDARGIMRLVVVGAMTEYCVDTTCRRALSQGYDVTINYLGGRANSLKPGTIAESGPPGWTPFFMDDALCNEKRVGCESGRWTVGWSEDIGFDDEITLTRLLYICTCPVATRQNAILSSSIRRAV